MISRWWMALAFVFVFGVSSVLGGAAGSASVDVDNVVFLPMVSRAGLSIIPSAAPTQAPTEAPTPAPTDSPTDVPTEAPTSAPTQVPTEAPIGTPSPPVATATNTPIPPTKTPTGEMIRIAAGEFEMGCDEELETCWANEKPLHRVYLDAYEIDRYEVTNARYQACVLDDVCTEPGSLLSPNGVPYFGEDAFDNYPVINVTWEQAKTFCEWEDSRLPTEAEWERAARGDADTRIFPWGDDEPTCERANGAFDDNCALYDIAEVGSHPTGASPDGLMDMSGNVLEWVNDWYDADYYQSMPADEPANNPTGPSTGDAHVLRGGSWSSPRQRLRVAYRYGGGDGATASELHQIGFRCARSYAAGE